MARKKVSEYRGKDLSGLSLKELRSAYTTYRDAMIKAAKRLSKGTASQKQYANVLLDYENIHNPRGLKTLKMIDSFVRPGWTEETYRRDMLKRVQELQKLEQSPRYSLSGWQDIEKRTVQSLQAHGYKNINKKNLKAFGNFMDKMRSAFGNKIFPSEEVAELFDAAGGELSDMDESEILGILDDLGADISGVDLFA